MKKVELKPMSGAQFEQWLADQIKSYAESKVRSGNWPSGGALERARTETQNLLFAGLQTPYHRIFNVVCNQETVGNLWIKMPTSSEDAAYIYNIEIKEIRRGHGYGSGALEEMTQILKAEGVKKLSLHVFGFNTDARRLYARLGFEITNINMSKNI